MKKLFFLFLAFQISACSQFEPFEDMRREAGQIPTVGQSSNDFPAICYNPIWHNEKQLQELAKIACKRTNRKPIFQRTKAFSCRLINPSVAIYKCK